MTDSWQALREVDRNLALCLLFSPANGRALLADRLSLACETEAALHLASEPVLAAIRLQWWVDATEARRHDSVPLMQRLVTHLEAGSLSEDQILAQIGLWQDRIADTSMTSRDCWARFFVMLANANEDETIQVAAGLAGEACGQPQGSCSDPDDEAIAPLRTRRHQWMWMCALAARHRASASYVRDDPMMVWRMLSWRLGITKPSPRTSR